MTIAICPLAELAPECFAPPGILKQLAAASRQLAELKGVGASIPYQGILINNLFTHPYTKIQFVEEDLSVSRLTATKYLDALVAAGFLQKRKVGRSSYYMNVTLNAILTGEAMTAPAEG